MHKDDKATVTYGMIHVDQLIEWSMRHKQVVKIHDTDASDIENQNAKSEISKPSRNRTKHKNNSSIGSQFLSSTLRY